MDYYVLGLAIWDDPFCIWGRYELVGVVYTHDLTASEEKIMPESASAGGIDIFVLVST